ncbi:hypothetical protein QQG55_24950 [Brugia pahangi]|uniref:Uncharacterized protein n=1 Tax=Brugia pahangi TaxID=6280 RepID=A0A0N4SYY2_BRUPA|nr:unnamed protein product [Brugia pahangi]
MSMEDRPIGGRSCALWPEEDSPPPSIICARWCTPLEMVLECWKILKANKKGHLIELLAVLLQHWTHTS